MHLLQSVHLLLSFKCTVRPNDTVIILNSTPRLKFTYVSLFSVHFLMGIRCHPSCVLHISSEEPQHTHDSSNINNRKFSHSCCMKVHPSLTHCKSTVAVYCYLAHGLALILTLITQTVPNTLPPLQVTTND